MTTVVTCYYKINSKHTHDHYEQWIRNLLNSFQGNMVLFTTPDLISFFDSIETKACIHIIAKELHNVKIVQKYQNIWNEQEKLDKEKIPSECRASRTKECYMIWNSKLDFMREAIQSNPFSSDKFVWNDIGNVRNSIMEKYIADFPNCDLISSGKIDITYIGNKLDDMPTQTDVIFQNQCQLSGSIFGSNADTIMKIYDLFYEMFDYYLKCNQFIGCDQQIWASLYCKYPHLFNIVDAKKYNKPSEVDEWFLLHHMYSQKTKFCLVGPGNTRIPPIGWGACESIVWDYYENLKKKGFHVEFLSSTDLKHVIDYINTNNFTIVHIMYDDYVGISKYIQKSKVLYTSHFAFITHPEFETRFVDYFQNKFLHAVNHQPHLHKILAISDQIKNKYIQHGVSPTIIEVLHNGAREDKFKYYDNPSKGERSIYLAKVENRKGQYKYQHISSIDFAGNYQDSPFNCSSSQYLGEWTKEALYNNLSNYGNLVLLSEGEADPLVVKEALLCGLGIVISECCSANLDLTKKFITVIPENKLNDIEFVENEINRNREISRNNRENIRSYGLDTFSWNVIVDKYLKICL